MLLRYTYKLQTIIFIKIILILINIIGIDKIINILHFYIVTKYTYFFNNTNNITFFKKILQI